MPKVKCLVNKLTAWPTVTHALQIADFGVARIIENTGHMTAETGTYRWMAPEVRAIPGARGWAG